MNDTILATAPNTVIAVPLLTMLAAASITDFHHRRIPNGISLGAAAIGLATQTALFGLDGTMLAAAGWVLGLLCFMPLYVSGGMAAGDVKLMAAVGAFVGPVNVLFVCISTAIAGSVLGAGYLAARRFSELLAERAAAEGTAGATGANIAGKIPYAAAIAVGTAVVVLEPPFLSFILPSGGWS